MRCVAWTFAHMRAKIGLRSARLLNIFFFYRQISYKCKYIDLRPTHPNEFSESIEFLNIVPVAASYCIFTAGAYTTICRACAVLTLGDVISLTTNDADPLNTLRTTENRWHKNGISFGCASSGSRSDYTLAQDGSIVGGNEMWHFYSVIFCSCCCCCFFSRIFHFCWQAHPVPSSHPSSSSTITTYVIKCCCIIMLCVLRCSNWIQTAAANKTVQTSMKEIQSNRTEFSSLLLFHLHIIFSVCRCHLEFHRFTIHI